MKNGNKESTSAIDKSFTKSREFLSDIKNLRGASQANFKKRKKKNSNGIKTQAIS